MLDIENPADCIGLHGVPLYDIEGMCKLVTSNQTNEAHSAMQLLTDMARYRLLCGQTGYIRLHKLVLEKLVLNSMPGYCAKASGVDVAVEVFFAVRKTNTQNTTIETCWWNTCKNLRTV